MDTEDLPDAGRDFAPSIATSYGEGRSDARDSRPALCRVEEGRRLDRFLANTVLDEQSLNRGRRARRRNAARASAIGSLQMSAPGGVEGLLLTQILPRLALAHRLNGASETSENPPPPAKGPDADAMAERLARAAAQSDDALEAEVAAALASDDAEAGLDDLVLRGFGGAAERLGEFWLEDSCAFSDVTIGVARLQRALRDLPHRGATARPIAGQPRALLAPTPGEDHVFGLSVVGDFLSRAGWSVTLETAVAGAAADRVANAAFDIVGFTCSGPEKMDALCAEISAVRRRSKNRTIGVLVGGGVVARPTDTDAVEDALRASALAVGADAAALDAPDAVTAAAAVLEVTRRPR